MHALLDEVLCARWLENPYYQYFCGEEVFRHELPFDRSSLSLRRRASGRLDRKYLSDHGCQRVRGT